MAKEFKYKVIDPVGDLKDSLWQALNSLRSSISSNDFHIILFFLILKKEELLDNLKLLSTDEIKFYLRDRISNFESENSEQISELYKGLYESIIERIDPKTLQLFIYIIESLDSTVLEEHFQSIFDDFLYKYAKSQGRNGGENLLPLELSRFICKLAEIKPNNKVYNPFSGFASFAVFLKQYQYYLGQEINKISWAIGSLRILAYKKNNITKFILSDSISQWIPSPVKKFDLIIASPPLRIRLQEHIIGKFGIIRTCEHFLLEKGLENLNDGGKLIAIIPNGVLFSSGIEQKLRRYLVENDLIELVISFPAGLLLNTTIPIAILVINKKKKKKENGIVRFIDATSFVKNISINEKRLNDNELISVIYKSDTSNSLRIISNSTIKDSDYNLNVPRYFAPKIDNESNTNQLELKDLLTIIRGQKITEGQQGKFIRIRNLKEDLLDYKLDVNIVEQSTIPNTARKISESCLLIATKWKTIKPTYFDYSGESIFIIPDTLAFRVDETKINISYLINELQSTFVTDQIESFRMGSVIPYIRRDDLLNLKIRVVTFKEQLAIVSGIKEAYIKNREKELQLERELLGIKEDTFREFASIRHTFRQYLNALKANVSGTRKFLLNNTGKSIDLNTIYSKNLNRTLGEHLLSLEGTINSMSQILMTNEEAPAQERILKNNSLQALILEAQNRFKNSEIFEFEKLYVDKKSFNLDGEIIKPIIQFNDEDFFQVFSNIISNAIDHGFKNSKKQNVIRTSLTYNEKKNCFVIEISNNGRPIPKDFTFKRLITRGEKTTDSNGSGSGGADIKSILEKYKGSFDIMNQENEEFPVTYIIRIPLINQQ